MSQQYVTLGQMANAAGKTYLTVFRHAQRAGLLQGKPEGEKQHRIPVAKANRFLARQWPGTTIKEDVP